MRLLSRGKANINLPDGKSGRMPLHHAVERDDLSTVGFLILEVCILRCLNSVDWLNLCESRFVNIFNEVIWLDVNEQRKFLSCSPNFEKKV
jgi:hypothetical protein